MKLEGSCHCQAVKFECESQEYFPYQLCYCSICRKTMGGGGFAINIAADRKSLRIKKGKASIAMFHAWLRDESNGERIRSSGQRRFCKRCGSGLWVYDPAYPEIFHPFASAIDTQIPAAPEHTHVLLNSKASWVEPHIRKGDKHFAAYPKESIESWHKRVVKTK